MADRVLLVAMPLLAILVFGVVFYVSSSRQAVLSLQSRLSIRLIARNNSTSAILPDPNIGTPGGVVATARYLQDGLNGFYPLYTSRANPGIIYVESQVARNYTLGDFFEVWGKPLGPLNTIGVRGNSTYFWDMCVRDPGALGEHLSFEWGNHALRNGEVVDLVYSIFGCG